MEKHLVIPSRKRRVPARFSWIDHRLVKHKHFKHSSSGAMKLYLFLATVSDAEGLSFYGLRSLSCNLNMSESDINKYRNELIELDLIAYEKPLYQILDLSIPTVDEQNNMRNVFAQIAEKETETKPKSIWREGNIPATEAQSFGEIFNNYTKVEL